MNKRLITIFLAILLICTLCVTIVACSNKENNDDSNPNGEQTDTPSTDTPAPDDGGSSPIAPSPDDGGSSPIEPSSSNLVFELKTDDTYEVVSYTGNPISVVIPATYNDKAVTSIGDEAFEDCRSLSSVTIPNSVTNIGSCAFLMCDSLSSVNYLGTIEQWCGFMFGVGANPLSYGAKLYLNGELVEHLVIPSTITEIKDYAFYHCTSIKSVTIGNSVTSIGEAAFRYCTSLTKVTVGNSVTSTGKYTFSGCYKLVEIYNLSSLTIEKGSDSNGYVGYYALDVYTSIDTPSKLSTDSNGYIIHTNGEEKTLVGYAGSETELTLPSGTTSINKNAFYENDTITSVVIPDSVTSIGDYAFYYCTSLSRVTIPNSVTSIGEDAFSGCPIEYASIPTTFISIIPQSNLKEVVITGGDSVGNSAFDYCYSLSSVTIGNSVTSIGNRAFYDCDSITSITIGNSVTSIGGGAFSSCASLSSVNYLGTIEQWCCITFGGSSANPLYYAKKLYLNGELVEDLVIPNTVTEIKDYAFEGCSSITSVTIPDSVTSIGSSTFDYCYRLVEVYNLSSLTIEKGSYSNGYVGYYALDVYTSLDTPSKLSTDSNGYIIHTNGAEKTLVGYTGSETELTLPSGITSINRYAFLDINTIISVVIPDSVTSIGNAAFSSCYRLVEVYNLSSLTIEKGSDSNGYVGYYALDVYTSLYTPSKLSTDSNGYIIHTNGKEKTLVGYVGSETELTLPSGIASINQYAFSGCTSLSSVTIPDSVTSVGEYAFYDCDSLKSVTIPDSVTSIGERAFCDCASLSSVTIGNSVTSIEEGAFSGCDSLTSVTIPDSVTSIGDWAFYNCTSLSSVTIGNSVTSIGERAFWVCTSLSSVTIGNSVISILRYAFSGCHKLVEVYNLSSLTIEKGSYSNGYVGYYAWDVYTSLDTPSKLSTDSNGYIIYTNGEEKTLVGYVGSETELTLPSGINSIYKYSFYNDDTITSVVIPDSVTSIGSYAFADCNSLTSVTIGNSVTSIGNYAFAACDSLSSVTIPDSVTSIGDDAFRDCTSLTSVTIGNSVTSIGSWAFYSGSLSKVYYNGTKEEWSGISIGGNGSYYLTNATRYYYSETEPTTSGNYWHYVGGVPTPW